MTLQQEKTGKINAPKPTEHYFVRLRGSSK